LGDQRCPRVLLWRINKGKIFSSNKINALVKVMLKTSGFSEELAKAIMKELKG